MKTFVSLNLDNEHPSESGVVVFQAESKEDAVMAVALEILDEGEIEDYEENVEEGEDILVSSVSFDEAYKMVEQGKIDSAIPILAIQWLALNRKRVQQQWKD